MSWSGNGNTSPTWRGCEHVLANGRCSLCRAVHIPYYVQPSHYGVTFAIPLGSPELVTPDLDGLSSVVNSDAQSKKRFMGKAA